MTTMTRKEIVQALDAAARRAALAEARPASSKQTWFLAGLMEQTGSTPQEWGYGWSNTNACLTAARASALIEQLQAAAAAQRTGG